MQKFIHLIEEIKFSQILIIIFFFLFLILLIFFLLKKRRKRKKSVIEEEIREGYIIPKTPQELVCYVKERLNKILEEIDYEKFKEDYNIIKGYISRIEEKFLLVVFGEFNSGKSSFINAFLGEEILPTGIIPTTATINKISFGEEKTLKIIFDDGRIEITDNEKFKTYLKDEEVLKRIDYVNFFYPSQKLKNIDIVDTPGLNSVFEYHEKRALDFINKSDGVLWLFHPNEGGSQSEKEYLQKIKGTGKKIIGIISHKDSIPSEEELNKLKNFLYKNFGEFIEQIFAISSRQAIQSIIIGDSKGYAESGFSEVEDYLKEKIFDRIQKAKIESIILSSQKNALNLCSIMKAEVYQLKEIEKFWNYITELIINESLSINKDTYHKVITTLDYYFVKPRKYAREKIEELFSFKNSLYNILFKKGEFKFIVKEELFEKIDKNGILESIPSFVEYCKKRWLEVFKRVEMELMIENEKRKKSKKPKILYKKDIPTIINLEKLFNYNEENDILNYIFNKFSKETELMIKINFFELIQTKGQTFNFQKSKLQKNLSNILLILENSYIYYITEKINKNNIKVRNSLIKYLAPSVLNGIKSPIEFSQNIEILEKKIEKINDIIIDLQRLYMW